MRYRQLAAALALVSCAAFVACSSTSQVIPTQSHRTPQNLVNQPGTGGDGGGASPTPQPTPNAVDENACTSAGGTFYDDVGGSGVTCAGQPNGPGAVTSYNANRGYTIEITKGHGSISRSGTVLGEFSMGIDVYDSDCSYTMFS